MKVLFMGTPRFAVPPLEKLMESHHEVALVITQPDKKAGRGQAMHAPPIKQLALRQGLTVLQPSTVRDEAFLETIRSRGPDVMVVVAYGKILPQAVLDVPRFGCINVHASLLPLYRGAAPINWAIMRGERETGVTIMRMDAGLDTGGILCQERVDILEDDDARSVSDMLSVIGAQKLMEILDKIEKEGSLQGQPQDSTRATYAPLLKKEDGRINWSRPTEELICLVRGTYPWPGAFTTLGNDILKVLRVEPLWESACESVADFERLRPGTVALTVKTHGFAVRTGDGLLLVTEAQPAGRRPLSGVDIVNGNHVKKGALLGG
jgi:methionyl-tRNA formyltransferase